MSNAIQLDRCERRLYSLGSCCQELQVDGKQLRSLIQAAQVEPALQLDSVPYFSTEDLKHIREQLACEQKPTV